MRLSMAALLALILWQGGALRAQTNGTEDAPYRRVSVMPEVKVYVAPLKNGTEREAAYFKAHFETELVEAGYALAETRADSDFYMPLSVKRREGAAGAVNVLNVALFNTRGGQRIANLNWPYTILSEMDARSQYILYQAMKNAAIVKAPPGVRLAGARKGAPAAGEGEPHTMALYAGLRAGGFLSLYAFQTTRGYEGGTGRAFSGEAALLAEFHPWRFLSVQAEAAVLYEAFGESREAWEDTEIQYSGGFSALSLNVPLLIKAPLDFGRFTLSPFVGAYYILPLGPMSANLDGDERQYAWRVDHPPAGVSLGIDLALPLGQGKMIGGLRYEQDVGTAAGEDTESPVYSRSRMGLSLGWAWKLIGRSGGEREAPAAEAPAEAGR